MKLHDLSILKRETEEKYHKYFSTSDRKIPNGFKQKISQFDDDRITYNDFTFIVQRSSEGTIYAPNQWLYVAAFYTSYCRELMAYKQELISYLLTKYDSKKATEEPIRSCQNNAENAISLLEGYTNSDNKEYLIKFLSDYSWWGGAKTIDRSDFCASAILSSAKLVNASQSYIVDICEFLANHHEAEEILLEESEQEADRNTTQEIILNKDTKLIFDYLTAIRAKPFLLLAGISGTGKSRKVQELAYLTCKRDGIHDVDETSPGNYLLIPVKPNWHDSTELLGYYSSITGKYVLTDFIRFLWKAWMHRDVPYFLCLDEMNLAPVEQYFAEYLSILETRKRVYNEDKQRYEIQTAELLSKKLFEGLETYKVVETNDIDADDGIREKSVPLYKGEDVQIINFLKEHGLRLPDNLFVIGTVNMDDTTHQFSRKVIDRAFTIEMNGDELSKMFNAEDALAYQESPLSINAIRPRFIKAQEVLEAYPQDAEIIKEEVPAMLDKINGEGIFKNTPFRVSYRVQNELVLYYAAIRPNGDLQPDAIRGYLREAFMAVLLEKILPRVEGDEKAMHCNDKGDSVILQTIRNYLTEYFTSEGGEQHPLYTALLAKLDEMNDRVKNSYFTSFFS